MRYEQLLASMTASIYPAFFAVLVSTYGNTDYARGAAANGALEEAERILRKLNITPQDA